MPQYKRIIIVSNRLPVSVNHGDRGIEFIPSTGGLATGLRSLPAEYTTSWIGWPGIVSPEDRSEVEARLNYEFQCIPIFIPERLVKRYYEGFSNRTVWPLFHSFPAYAKYNSSEWNAYKEVNKLFCEMVLQHAQPGDLIWIHDYHLMLLPRYIRERLPSATIGFFLHIPFPAFDILRLLPQHREILEHLMGSDLIGFHTYEYAHSFLGNARRIFGVDNTMGQIIMGNRALQVDVFPMGIDFYKYSAAADTPEVQNEVVKIKNEFGPRKLIFTVSRLDYTKGIPETLQSIAEFFRRYLDYHGEVNILLVVVPSREEVERYAHLKKEIDELVGQINSKYGNLNWIPIRYIYRALSFAELVALYVAADIAYIAPLRDGMNLIAKEYLAAKNEGRGVLIVSEMAGAAKELLEAIIINPNSREEGAEALYQALQMPLADQMRYNQIMRQRLMSHDIVKWIERFFRRLHDVSQLSMKLSVRLLDAASRELLVKDFVRANRRFVILDYDGTLVPFAEKPEYARPDDELLILLDTLSSQAGTDIVLLSGRDHETLDRWFEHISRLTLVAEHGGWVLKNRKEGWQATLGTPEDTWKTNIRPVMELFVDRIPGSFIEEKTFSLVCHYRKAESESASTAAKELLDTLTSFTSNMNIQVLLGNKTIELRPSSISKGIFLSRKLVEDQYDFILAIGDDWTDEDMFAVLPGSAYSVKVGIGVSEARYNVESYRDVRSILMQLGGNTYAQA
ncbi:MAG: bifunctional alpha,alpha-trehalose-phosphate synthase (UDP-forming)/trehalose-phosphatase [Proteobacteria bacterium]|nr:bifunctional alpha,alpha-trehalose-phosphate synthase (UDP-forming)/trehalose-phosphatase [Pseudomonadota bacterium]